MPHYLFADFLTDRGQYAAAERYWETLWQEVSSSGKALQAPWTMHWIHNPLANGKPMFTAVCRALHKGVRIIHEEVGDHDDVDLDWWLDDFGDQNGSGTIHELVIACCPSAENIPRVRQLLKQWAQGDEVPLPQGNGSWNESSLNHTPVLGGGNRLSCDPGCDNISVPCIENAESRTSIDPFSARTGESHENPIHYSQGYPVSASPKGIICEPKATLWFDPDFQVTLALPASPLPSPCRPTAAIPTPRTPGR